MTGWRAMLLVLAGSACLAACDAQPERDWRAELKAHRDGVRGRIDPLPAVPPFEPYPLQIQRDPFEIERARR